jgi:hypothetical protein
MLSSTGDMSVLHSDTVGLRFLAMRATIPRHGDAPAALVMAALFLSFGLFAILSPEKLGAAMDNFANAWRQRTWHPYQMPPPVLRLVVGGAGIGGAALFLYIAYVGLSR